MVVLEQWLHGVVYQRPTVVGLTQGYTECVVVPGIRDWPPNSPPLSENDEDVRSKSSVHFPLMSRRGCN